MKPGAGSKGLKDGVLVVTERDDAAGDAEGDSWRECEGFEAAGIRTAGEARIRTAG